MTLSISKPIVGGSNNAWGQIINDALDDIATEINTNAATTTGTVNPTTFQIGGVNVTTTAAELNVLDGATITTNELNVLDGDTSATSTTVADADRVVFNDNGTMKQVSMSDIATYIGSTTSSGTVTSVNVSVPTGLSVSGGPVTTSGTIAISLASGYAIPTSASLTNYDTFVGYGNHAAAGYISSIAGGTGISVSGSGASRTISLSGSSITDVFSSSSAFSSTRIENLGSSTENRLYIGTFSANNNRYASWSTSSNSSGAFYKAHIGGVHKVGVPSQGSSLQVSNNSSSTAQFWLYLPAGVTLSTTSGTNQSPSATGISVKVG